MPSGLHTLTLAQESEKHYTLEQRKAVKEWAALTGLLILFALLVVGAVLVVLSRQRRALLRPIGEGKRKKVKAAPDAWSESAKRIDPGSIGSEDDTVDIDPDELGPGDVGHGPDPHGEGPHG
jgi:hypothetical protein